MRNGKKILVERDFSLPPRRTVEYATGIAPPRPFCREALFAVSTGVPDNEGAFGELFDPQKVELQGAEKHQLELSPLQQPLAAAARSSAEPLPTATRLLRRSIAQDSLDETPEHGYDAVVVGEKGPSKTQQIGLGRVSRDLLQKAKDLVP